MANELTDELCKEERTVGNKYRYEQLWQLEQLIKKKGQSWRAAKTIL